MELAASKAQILPHGEPVALDDIRDALIIKEGPLFLMSDNEGNIPAGSKAGYGLYKNDTRYLSVYDMTLNGTRPIVLLSSADLGYGSEHHVTNPHMSDVQGRALGKDSVELVRQRMISAHNLMELIQITNYNLFPVDLDIRFSLNADFADIFEVRGEKRRKRGRLLSPQVQPSQITYARLGLDGVRRATAINFEPAPTRIWDSGSDFRVKLDHRQSCSICVRITPDRNIEEDLLLSETENLEKSYSAWLRSCTNIFTNNEFFNTMVERSLTDVRMLQMHGKNGNFVAAGTPWFEALFGRDSLIASMQLLSINPSVARDTLRILASWQGKEYDDWRDEEPGKILHELRTGEMASLGEIPMTPYYGSIDSTLLFLMLAAQYVSWTGDLDLIRGLESSLLAALDWANRYGDVDRCGYVEYFKRSPKGILNQGWKDSKDGVVNADGTMVKPPIALVEVQGYVYAATRGMAWLFSMLGNHRLASKLRRDAACLKDRFNLDYWLEDEKYYALALGGDKDPASSITSNPGHCLWTGLVDKSKAIHVVERLFMDDMFSGWGIRTLSSQSSRYNPMGYHLGSIWPHDNAIIGMGFKRYGFEAELNELATAIYDTCRNFDYYRLPELFCGSPRTLHNRPVRYPVACRPQAWAAGSIPMLLQAILGLVANAPKNELTVVNPVLPYWLEDVEVRGLRVGDHSVDLLYEQREGRTKVSVINARGVRVRVAANWPSRTLHI